MESFAGFSFQSTVKDWIIPLDHSLFKLTETGRTEKEQEKEKIAGKNLRFDPGV